MTVSLDALHEQGRAAVLEGGPRLDVPPGDGDRRWGVSVLMRVEGGLAERLDAEAGELAALAGPGHWPTGALGSAHLTVFSLEPHRVGVGPDDPAVERYAEATARAAAGTPAPAFDVVGLALTPGGVVARCLPANPVAAGLRAAVNAALGAEAFETGYRGDQWWSSLLHFAAPVAEPEALVAHVAQRRDRSLGRFTARALDLVRYEYRQAARGAGMVPISLASTPFAG